MPTPIRTITRKSYRDIDKPLNIVSYSTHERYQENLAKTGHTFYLWQGEGIKPWASQYAELPDNHVLLDGSKGQRQIPINVDIDLVLSQNKCAHFDISKQIANHLGCPMISLEHTLPPPDLSKAQLVQTRYMKADLNVFISEYNRKAWGWEDDETAEVVHHGINTDLFCVGDSVREECVLSVVNDWENRNWCCGFKLWLAAAKVGTPEQLPVKVFGDNPGLSNAAESVEELAKAYQTSQVFLNTSLISPIPTALLEAMSCGCAVVSTNNCMIPEIIEDGYNGFLANTPEAIHDKVVLLLKDKDLAAKMGLAASATIREKFGLSNFITNWNEVFKKCLNEI